MNVFGCGSGAVCCCCRGVEGRLRGKPKLKPAVAVAVVAAATIDTLLGEAREPRVGGWVAEKTLLLHAAGVTPPRVGVGVRCCRLWPVLLKVGAVYVGVDGRDNVRVVIFMFTAGALGAAAAAAAATALYVLLEVMVRGEGDSIIRKAGEGARIREEGPEEKEGEAEEGLAFNGGWGRDAAATMGEAALAGRMQVGRMTVEEEGGAVDVCVCAHEYMGKGFMRGGVEGMTHTHSPLEKERWPRERVIWDGGESRAGSSGTSSL